MSEPVKTTINVGNIWNSDWHGGYAGTVFGTTGLSPAINAMRGGGRMPYIIEKRDKSIPSEARDRWV